MTPFKIAATALVTCNIICLNVSWAQNALDRSVHNVSYDIKMSAAISRGDSPFWLVSNQYGLPSIKGNNGYLRTAIKREVSADSLHKWHIGYGVDVAVAYNNESAFHIQQLFADFDYKLMRLTIGAKQHLLNLKNQQLSSGGQTLGINSRPMPEIRIEMPEYWNITGKHHHWAAVRGHISYGLTTDGGFQADYTKNDPLAHYAKKAILHTKSGFLRLGNAQKFPLLFEGGLEMATMFGGVSYKSLTWDGIESSAPVHLSHGFKDFAKALFALGSDPTDGVQYGNAAGNTLGSWLARLTWQTGNWSLSCYYDHFFEDHSQMFMQYGWLDGMVGIEIKLPKNRFVNDIVYEYLKTTYQSGPLYHDHTEAIPDQISAGDNYYNHNLYCGWQHWGQAIGNPFFISPLYNHTSDLTFTSNRFKSHHLAIAGQPMSILSYRLFYSHQRSLGTYNTPFYRAHTSHDLLLDVTFSPERLGQLCTRGWHIGAAFALDRGNLIGNNTGFQLTISKTGLLTK